MNTGCTASSTGSIGAFGGWEGTGIFKEISNMLIPKTPQTGQKPFEGSNPSLSAKIISNRAVARRESTLVGRPHKRGITPVRYSLGLAS